MKRGRIFTTKKKGIQIKLLSLGEGEGEKKSPLVGGTFNLHARSTEESDQRRKEKRKRRLALKGGKRKRNTSI